MSSLAGDLTERWGRSYETLIGHVTFLTLAVAGLGIAASGVVDAMRGGPDVTVLCLTGVVLAVLGLVGWRFTTLPRQIRILDVFITVTLAWVVLAFVGALPYVLTGWIPAFDDAVFESISGFTTTGATVLRPIEGTGPGVLFWRALSQWMGGMGVIVLVVAVLPTVGSGGMSLLEAEAPGPTGERLTPRVRQTARRLWAVYIGFTIVLALAYIAAGMNLFDGVVHSFTTVSTGGFSPYNGSLGHFDSAAIEWIAIVAMFIAGSSFTLLYRLLRGSPGPLLRSKEFRLYALLVVAVSAVLFVVSDAAGSISERVRGSFFATTTIVSTTGYATQDFGGWSDSGAGADPAAAPDRRDGGFDRGWRQAHPGAGRRQLRPSGGAPPPASTAGAAGSGRRRHPARSHGQQDRRVPHPGPGDVRRRGIGDRAHRPRHPHVVLGGRRRRSATSAPVSATSARRTTSSSCRAWRAGSRWARCCWDASRSTR